MALKVNDIEAEVTLKSRGKEAARCHTAAVNPTVNDDAAAGFEVPDSWLNTVTDKEFVCADATNGAAVWVERTKDTVYTHPNHTGEVTSTADGAQVVDKTAISGKSLVTALGTDHVLLGDASDGDNLKKALVSDFLGAGTDNAAIHDDVAAEISAITEKTTPVGNDLIVIEDSAASDAKKKVKLSNLPLQVKTISKVSDQAITSSTVLQADDELKFSVLNGETWAFEFSLVTNEASSNPNIKLRLAATAGLTGSIEYHWNKLGSTVHGHISNFTTDSGTITLTTAKETIIITGVVKATANGTLQLEWAQDTSDADATTVYALSKVVASKV